MLAKRWKGNKKSDKKAKYFPSQFVPDATKGPHAKFQNLLCPLRPFKQRVEAYKEIFDNSGYGFGVSNFSGPDRKRLLQDIKRIMRKTKSAVFPRFKIVGE